MARCQPQGNRSGERHDNGGVGKVASQVRSETKLQNSVFTATMDFGDAPPSWPAERTIAAKARQPGVLIAF